MASGTGMRGKDLQKFLMVARDRNVILLVRHTNEDSLAYVGLPGYYPKPALVKAKTADVNPPGVTRSINGRMVAQDYVIAGLVVHPGIHPGAYKASRLQKAMDAWKDGMHYLAGNMPPPGDPNRPETWAAWGVGRAAACSSEWRWRVDVDPASRHYGCLQLSQAGKGWNYIHGDYDLKDVIVPGRNTEMLNQRNEGKLYGVKNFTPLLTNMEFETIRLALNTLIGADMVQHGAEAQFAWHGDEPITVAFPDWSFEVLGNAATVQHWYEKRNRKVLATPGHDYLRDRSRMFHFGPQGMFAPGALPSSSWG